MTVYPLGGIFFVGRLAYRDRNRLPRPINTLLFDHKSSSPDSLLGLVPSINKPPLQRIAAPLTSLALLY